MTTNFTECIRQYINAEYRKGGLIGISDLAEYCKASEGKIIVALTYLESIGEVEIIERYFCPEAHFIPAGNIPYCQICSYNYSEDFITTSIYVKPLKLVENVN